MKLDPEAETSYQQASPRKFSTKNRVPWDWKSWEALCTGLPDRARQLIKFVFETIFLCISHAKLGILISKQTNKPKNPDLLFI
jgi:hypothetical protein